MSLYVILHQSVIVIFDAIESMYLVLDTVHNLIIHVYISSLCLFIIHKWLTSLQSYICVKTTIFVVTLT